MGAEAQKFLVNSGPFIFILPTEPWTVRVSIIRHLHTTTFSRWRNVFSDVEELFPFNTTPGG
jgi:hypothetical protein